MYFRKKRMGSLKFLCSLKITSLLFKHSTDSYHVENLKAKRASQPSSLPLRKKPKKHALIRANEINYEDRGDPGGCRSALASLFPRFPEGGGGHVLSGCNQFRTVRRKPVEREETGSRKGGGGRGRRIDAQRRDLRTLGRSMARI